MFADVVNDNIELWQAVISTLIHATACATAWLLGFAHSSLVQQEQVVNVMMLRLLWCLSPKPNCIRQLQVSYYPHSKSNSCQTEITRENSL